MDIANSQRLKLSGNKNTIIKFNQLPSQANKNTADQRKLFLQNLKLKSNNK